MPFNYDATPINFVLNGAGWNGTTPVPYGVGTGTVNNGVYNELQDLRFKMDLIYPHRVISTR